jgi:hypothetical protein
MDSHCTRRSPSNAGEPIRHDLETGMATAFRDP